MHKAAIILIILFALVFSFQDFLVQPAYWFDEAITIEIARNFYLFGELDILTAPGVFSGVPYIAGTNGYPLTILLAAFFRVAGYGLLQARLFMLVWLAVCLITIYVITRKMFGIAEAIIALLLIATFASLYGNGLTATGELLGFFFFLLALYMISQKMDYVMGGVFSGLAMAAKPGVFLFLAHAVFLFIILCERDSRVKSMARYALGCVPPIMLWILLAFPFTKDTFFSTMIYALNPLDIPILRNLFDAAPITNLNKDLIIPSSEGALSNIYNNLLLLITHSTGIYFMLIAAVVLAAYVLTRNQLSPEQKRFFQLSLLYGAFAIAYFVRGPGWIRYLFGFQILFLMLLYPSLQGVLRSIQERLAPRLQSVSMMSILCIIVLAAGQLYHLMYLSNIPRSRAVLDAVSFVQTRMGENKELSVGLVNVPEVAVFSDPARTYHMVWLQRTMSPFGRHIFENKNRPGLVLTDGKNFLLGKEGEEVLKNEYKEIEKFGRYHAYELAINITP
ncbi:MAG: hypothetical protein G01um101470_962 [Parcubacteria group bacterium Gr01-1014_70]|nr:MAG: hypothetical protein G01um101470_962 [Parcubacteria group bacterium Gr01-1014_70]